MDLTKITEDNKFKDSFYRKAIYFLNILESLWKKEQINLDDLYLDHICFRTETLNDYLLINSKVANFSTKLIETMVGGRMITTVKLHDPLIFKHRSIGLIEIPSPKANTAYLNQFEHAEFVLDISFDSFIEKYPHLSFDRSALSKNINPELKIALSELYSVKFHHKSLEDIIKEEIKIELNK